jgi:hypothetical protein
MVIVKDMSTSLLISAVLNGTGCMLHEARTETLSQSSHAAHQGPAS